MLRNFPSIPRLLLFLGAPPSLYVDVFINLEALQTASVRVFMEASLYRHDWLNQQPFTINSTSSPSPLPRDLGVGLKIPTLISHDLFPGNKAPFLKRFPKVTSLTNSGVVESSLLWITNDVPFTFIPPDLFLELGTKPKYYNTRYPYCSYHLASYKGFRSSVPGTREEDQIYNSYPITTSQHGKRYLWKTHTWHRIQW